MNTKEVFVFLITLMITQNIIAGKIIYGQKGPNDNEPSEAFLAPLMTKAILPAPEDFISGMNHFVPFMMATPDQENAGSCLFMAHTAAVEVLVNQNRYHASGALDNVDLSERYLMNLSKAGIGDDLIENWVTDTVYRFNKTGKSYTNTQFPYIKDWYKSTSKGRVFAKPNERGAYYGVNANWVIALDQLEDLSPLKLPAYEREIIFEDPAKNRWNVTTAPTDITEKVKKALDKKQGPVIAIYNHTGFWHAVMIGGYNDTVTHNCPFVGEYDHLMNLRADQIEAEAAKLSDPSERQKQKRKADLFRKRGNSVALGLERSGGCSQKGAFYVRDSINPSQDMPFYDYDPKRTGEETRLNAPVILREYEWLEQLSNHVYVILEKKN